MIAPASRKLGKYEIVRKLGRGGMADVYLAQDAETQRQVALKLIEHSEDTDTVDFIEAERRGAVLQGHLANVDPRVARIYDSGDLEGFFFVAMEYVDGQDLAELLRRGPLEPEYAADVALAVAQTLENAHKLHVTIDGREILGMVHGDIKPRNIRIDARGAVRVLDFGIAKALSLSRRLTRNEFGSVPYGSPERLEAGQVNEHSDLWSLAVMLYEMVTGLQPYHADSTERLESMIRSRVPPPPPPYPCPDGLRRILVKAMEPVPEMRYPSAAEFAAELRRFRAGETVEAAREDRDATRRTHVAAEERPGDETRRTVNIDETRRTQTATAKVVFQDKPQDKPQPQPPQVWPPKRPQTQLSKTVVRATGILLIVGTLWTLWAIGSDVALYRHGQQLEREISSEQLTDLNEIWKRWTELADDNPSSWLLAGPRKAVRAKFVAAADHVIESYRNSDTVYEKTWVGARDDLTHALTLSPDETVRGKLRLTEGHLARINAASHKSVSEYNDSVEKFNEAARLLPRSPDPELGLARVYVYGLNDIDKAYQVLQEAEHRGFALGNREKAQLADGYRSRADRLFWDSRNVRGLPQEKDQLLRVKEDYGRALGLYQGIAPWGNANASVVRVEGSLEQVQSRLEQIEQGINVSPTGGPVVQLPKQTPPWLKRVLEALQSHAAKQ